MLYREYGKTGKKISVIGFGAMRFVRDGDIYDHEKCAKVVLKANELGINYFDTAPYYSNDHSESILGMAFKHMPENYYISTKSGALKGSIVRKYLERSLKRLGVPKIHFFHIWCVLNLEDYKRRMAKGGAYEAVLRAKEEGLVDHIAVSTHCSGEEIKAIVDEGFFEGVTLSYNILNFPYRQIGLKAAYEKRLGVATMNPLGGGLIPQRADYFDFIRGEKDSSVVDAALRFNCSHKEVTTVLAGMGTVEEVINNVKVVDDLDGFSNERLDTIKQRISASMDKLCTGCGYCKGCPQQLDIPKFMTSYNQRILGDIQSAYNFLKWHWDLTPEEAGRCLACGVCETKCTQHLPIIDRLKEITTWTVEI